MERLVQSVLQRVLGFDRYLRWFSRVKIRTLRWDRNERDVLHFISQLPPDGVVLDIGANIGIMTVLMARRVSRGRVHAFEPIPDNFRTLQRNVEHFGLSNVTLHQLALGEEQGELEMVMPEEQHVRMQGLSHVVGAPGSGDPDGRRYRVPQVRLDDLDVLADTPIAGIKIDVENFEQYVLRGGRQLLERWHPPIYAELGPNENRTRCLELVGSLGYTPGVLEGGRVVTYEPERHGQHNFFLCPPGAVGS
jgi:FkbM family methyltransferase